MALILPNTIANDTPADGDRLQQNFATIQSWANNDAINADGSVAMTAPLLLPGAPTQANQAATKAYVDSGGVIGAMVMFGGVTAPTNWMLCQGQAISRSTYAALFAVISTRFGVGDNSTTFNLPDMRGRYPIGFNQGGAQGDYFNVAVGNVGGTKDAVVVLHAHVGADHLHGVSINTGTESTSHQHGPGAGARFVTHADSGGLGGSTTGVNFFTANTTGYQTAAHTHLVSGNTGAADRTLNTSSTGVNGTDANLPPSVSFNFIIKVT